MRAPLRPPRIVRPHHPHRPLRALRALHAAAGDWTARRRLLLCGEGDFSFARALARELRRDEPVREQDGTIVATTIDSEQKLRAEFERGAEILDELRQRHSPAVRVAFGVDARDLKATLPPELQPSIERAAWLFPHTPGKANIARNRSLLAAFFGQAARLENLQDVWIVLAAAQAGLEPLDADLQTSWAQSWQPTVQAAAAGFSLEAFEPFDETRFDGYLRRGWRAGGREFYTPRPLLLKFSRAAGVRAVDAPSFSFSIQFAHPDLAAAERDICLHPRDIAATPSFVKASILRSELRAEANNSQDSLARWLSSDWTLVEGTALRAGRLLAFGEPGPTQDPFSERFRACVHAIFCRARPHSSPDALHVVACIAKHRRPTPGDALDLFARCMPAMTWHRRVYEVWVSDLQHPLMKHEADALMRNVHEQAPALMPQLVTTRSIGTLPQSSGPFPLWACKFTGPPYFIPLTRVASVDNFAVRV